MSVARVLCLCLALAVAAAADKVVLKDGRSFDGVIVEENDSSVRIKTSKATLTFPREQIASVERAGGAAAEREVRLATLDPTKPAGYLETAVWLAGDGKDACDLPTLQKLCAAASKLAPSQAYQAQMVLGKRLEETGARRKAAFAYARALLAKPGDAEAGGKIEGMRQALVDEAKADLEQLAAALELVLADKIAEALPALSRAEGKAGSELASAMLGMSMTAFHLDVANRVPCKDCEGKGVRYCVVCEGKAMNVCKECNGTGERPGATGTDMEDFAKKVCRHCFGLKNLLCERCKAERDVVISYVPLGSSRRADATVHTKAGAEAEALKKEINLNTWMQVHSGHKLWGIRYEEPTVGGKSTCATCAGVKYTPPAVPPPLDKIREYLLEVKGFAEGRKTYDPVPAVKEAWDASAIADGLLRYRGGKWLK